MQTLQADLEKQGYSITGRHSAVKLCHWVRQSLYYGRPCYKQKFYGISTHRCIQMTPSYDRCTLSCTFCWRYKNFEGADRISKEEADDPVEMLDRIIETQRQLVSGFKGDSRCDQEMWKEARMPKHIAISLTGEPTLYPYLSEFIDEAKRRGMTTFLVTNGTTPEVLKNLDTLPTQLYVSLTAFDEESYRNTCVPSRNAPWSKIMETLSLLPSLDTRKVIRHTLVKDWNMADVKAYGRLDKIAGTQFIEVKGYSWVGRSRERLTKSNMPSMQEIKAFAEMLSADTGYDAVDESPDSHVVLLSRLKETKIQNP